MSHYLYETYGGQQSQLVSMDGKTMRGTIPKGTTPGVHLLAAYLSAEGVVLQQVKVGAKENEIKVAPQLVQAIDVLNRFRNPHLAHQLLTNSLNSTSKFPTRLLPSLLAYAAQFDETPPRTSQALSVSNYLIIIEQEVMEAALVKTNG